VNPLVQLYQDWLDGKNVGSTDRTGNTSDVAEVPNQETLQAVDRDVLFSLHAHGVDVRNAYVQGLRAGHLEHEEREPKRVIRSFPNTFFKLENGIRPPQ